MFLLHKAARDGQLQIVEYLLESGIKIEEKDKYQMTALHCAAQFGQLEIAKHLIEKGAQIEAKNMEGNTPLLEAVESGQLEMVKFLIEQGANLDAINENGMTAIKLSMQHQEILRYFVEKAIDQGILTDLKDFLQACIENNYLELFRSLVGNVSINSIVDTQDNQLIHLAAYFGHLEMVKYLIEKEAQLNSPNKFYETPLMIAIKRNQWQIVKYLIIKGAKLDIKDEKDQTSVHKAIAELRSSFGLDCAKYLVKSGANVNAKDKYGLTPLHEAARKYSMESFTFRDHLEVVKILINSGAEVDAKDNNGLTPLHVAAKERDKFPCPYKGQFPPLEIFKVLINSGAQFDIKNNDGKTPFDLAKHYEVKAYLLELQNKDSDKETISNKDPCVICMGPKNGFYALMPCAHASLCEDCCKKITKDKFGKCPTCRKPSKSYKKIFFQASE